MHTEPVITEVDDRGVATVTLNRPEANNAYNRELIEGLGAALDQLQAAEGVRVVVVKGNGRFFQAGADLKWINAVRTEDLDENLEVSRMTAAVVDRLNRVPLPVVSLIQGGCFGGGTGIVAASDVAIAAADSIFSVTEVRWGLHASIIIPQLADAMSVRQLRRYALTAERFSAAEAMRIGLVHQIVPPDQLEEHGEKVVAQLLANAPGAMATTKEHILDYSHGAFSPAGFERIVRSHAEARRTAEAAEGLASFAQKRDASWPVAESGGPAES